MNVGSIDNANLVDLLASAAADEPDRVALVCGEERITYARYAASARALAVDLRGTTRAGDRIATVLSNSVDACIAHFAVLACGAQLVPVNPQYTARELEHILRDADPVAVLADAGLRPQLALLLAALGIARVVWIGEGDRRLALEASSGAAGLLQHGVAASTGGVSDLPQIAPESLALLQYTGGTSGYPKGVNLTHRALLANVRQREAVLPTQPGGERIVCVMPLFHSYAIAMGLYLAANCRGTLIILRAYRREDLYDVIEKQHVTIFPGSPTIYIGMMEHPRFATTDWSALRVCYSGAAPLPAATLQRWQEAVGVPIYEGYGQTEAGPVLTYNGPRYLLKPGSVGLPLPDTDVQVVDPEAGEAVLPAGMRGEIRARGPQLMQGYRNLPAETAEALRDGWLYTGDIGEFDEDGYLYIRDRKKDLVLVGGYNVYPREIEEVLSWHPGVIEAAVVGTPDRYRGEALHAFVMVREPHGSIVEDLMEHCAQNLAGYKIPAAFHPVDALPRTGANKIDKKALRAQLTRRDANAPLQ